MLILRNDLSNLQSLLEEHFGKSGDPAHVSETVAEVLADIESEGDAAREAARPHGHGHAGVVRRRADGGSALARAR